MVRLLQTESHIFRIYIKQFFTDSYQLTNRIDWNFSIDSLDLMSIDAEKFNFRMLNIHIPGVVCCMIRYHKPTGRVIGTFLRM